MIMPIDSLILVPVQSGSVVLKPSAHLLSLAQNKSLAFKVDEEGYPEIWLDSRLWEVSGHQLLPAGAVVDPGPPGPVVRVMTLEDQAYIVAWIGRPLAAVTH